MVEFIIKTRFQLIVGRVIRILSTGTIGIDTDWKVYEMKIYGRGRIMFVVFIRSRPNSNKFVDFGK